MSRNPGGIGRIAINIGIGEVILFVMYQVFYQVIIAVNTTGSTSGVFKGSNGTLVNLVTLFYILGAALLPLALVKHAGFMFFRQNTEMPRIGRYTWRFLTQSVRTHNFKNLFQSKLASLQRYK